jgi:hypothetical protein
MGKFDDAVKAAREKKDQERARAEESRQAHQAEFEAARKEADEEYVQLIWPVLREADRSLKRQGLTTSTEMIVNPLKPSSITIGAPHSRNRSTISVVRRSSEPYLISWDVDGSNVREWRADSGDVVERLEEAVTAAIERSVH